MYYYLSYFQLLFSGKTKLTYNTTKYRVREKKFWTIKESTVQSQLQQQL